MKAAYRFIHKLIRSQKPTQLFKMLKFNRNHRACSRIGILNGPGKEVNKQNLMSKAVELYNDSNPNLKLMSIKHVKAKLKKLGTNMISLE